MTDNVVKGAVVPPANVVRHDVDDPYLVVAADKGTATFSDIANGVSADYGFWLGDAFASGGSVGYDHKKMGITARGAWEAVKRHFRTLGINTQTTPFTVAGIGDMSGDVFGNGMLLSEHIQLVVAFDHRHIFIDPHARYLALVCRAPAPVQPAPLQLGRLRQEPDLRRWRRVSAQRQVHHAEPAGRAVHGHRRRRELTPLELLQAILLAPVDLLYNGGIGTYVKASFETHAQVGDKAR
jgi:glutamate dehydrogenase